MAYFSNFPKMFVDISGDAPMKPIVVTNILARTRLLEKVKNNVYVYYLYDVKDNETPEIIAHKYYGNPNRHWVVLFANGVIDPLYDWVLPYDTWVRFMETKYGSIEESNTQIHHYHKIITKTESGTSLVSVHKYQITEDAYGILANSSEVVNLTDGTAVSIDVTKEAVSCYDYEYSLNESKRTIKLIDKIYVTQLENELKALLAR